MMLLAVVDTACDPGGHGVLANFYFNQSAAASFGDLQRGGGNDILSLSFRSGFQMLVLMVVFTCLCSFPPPAAGQAALGSSSGSAKLHSLGQALLV